MVHCQKDVRNVRIDGHCDRSPDGRHKPIVKSFPPKTKKGEKPLPYEFYCLVCGKTFEVPYDEVNK
jgi:hypothetical protein